MHSDNKTVLLVSMPFAETSIPSIQLALLESYLKERDINITTKHFYLKTADFYGLHNYNYLINSPNDSYAAQMVFSKYVFPDHWEKSNDKFRDFYDNVLAYDRDFLGCFPFDQYIEQTDKFYTWVCNQVNWKNFDIVGFTLNYGQFLPSLAVAKKIKETYPEKTIVFGGSTTVDELGVRVLKTFDWIDFIVSGDGEEALHLLASDYDNYQCIPGLVFRNGKDVIWNKNNTPIDLNQLSVPDFDSYYYDLSTTSNEVQQYFQLRGRLPIELSRGCWWNKCTFCNLRVYHQKYREKTIDRFIEELQSLSDKYKILTFHIIGNTLPQHDYRMLSEKIKKIGRDFTFYIEARAGKLKSTDYQLLKEAGFTNIQTGIEAFSPHYLKKMNKGVNVIDNIAALKYCKENGITNIYNIIVNYPNEEQIDFEQTKENIQHIKQYLDPPQISTFVVGYGSPIFDNLDAFNIEKMEYKKTDKIMYPKSVLEKKFCFFYNFKRKENREGNNWGELVENWKNKREELEIKVIKSKKLIDKLIFYFVDGDSFLKIYDKRNIDNVMIYVLDEIEREIFLSCSDVVSYQELQEKFSHIPDYQLAAILHTFEQNGIVFREEDHYLSLPLSYSKVCRSLKKEKTEQDFLITPVT